MLIVQEIIHAWALHYYIYKWNDAQADRVLQKLQPGQMTSFWDYSENYEIQVCLTNADD